MISNDCEFIERVTEMDETKPPRVIPMEIGPAREDHNALFEVMFADKKHALDGQIIRLERSFATKEVEALFVWFPPATRYAPREIERFAAASPITGSMFQFHEQRIRIIDCISRTTNSTCSFTRKWNIDIRIPGVSAALHTVEHNSRMINLGKSSAAEPGQSDSCIFQGENQTLEIEHNSLEESFFDLRLPMPIVVVTHIRCLAT